MQVHHATNTRRLPRILKMRAKWGDKGYGWLWIIKEILTEQKPYPVIMNTDRDLLFVNLNCDSEDEFIEFLNDCFNYGLLQTDGEYIWDRQAMLQKSKKQKAYGKAKANKAWKEGRVKDAMRYEEYYNVRRQYEMYATPHQIESNHLLRDILNPVNKERK